MSETPAFGTGIPTFMTAPRISIDALDGYDVAVLGVPMDEGVSYRRGARDAPSAIRMYSAWDRVDGQEYVDGTTRTKRRGANLTIADVGDVLVAPGNADETHRRIASTVSRIRRSAFPLILGGDHSITAACVQGAAAAQEHRSLGILHFDAHPDVEGPLPPLPTVWHGNHLRALVDGGVVTGTNIVSIGMRGNIPAEWIAYQARTGITMYTMADILERGLERVCDDAIASLKATCSAVYLTIDIDVLDPAHAPGTGTPSFGGIAPRDFLGIIPSFGALPLIGADLVEVCPQYDPSGRTMVAAADILWALLSYGFSSAIRSCT